MRWLLPIFLLACGGSSMSSGTGNSGGATQTLVVQPTNGQSLTVGPGGTLQLGAYERNSDPYYGGSGLVLVAANWASSAPAVATVDSGGLVTGVSTGSALITATADNFTGSVTVSVGTTMTGP